MSSRFPKAFRLLKRFQFQYVASASQRLLGRYIIIDYRSNECEKTRIGIIITRKHAGSVGRNRFKRIVREAFRLSLPHLPKGYDLVIRPRNGFLNATTRDIENDLRLFYKAE